jgi:FkbM family methyltransferase
VTEFVVGDAPARYIAEHLKDRFVLFDIGCSGGIHPAWRALGDRLLAHAFDPNVEEIERLKKKRSANKTTYVGGFVGVPEGHLKAEAMARGDFLRKSPWERLSIAKTIERHLASQKVETVQDREKMNLWQRATLSDRPVIYLPDYLCDKGIGRLDFVKLDIDGADFIVLQTLFETPLHRGILGMMLEVNFHGDSSPDHHTFHNTDRLMRQMGFDLFDLSPRKYSSGSLPWPYARDTPGQSVNGRLLQGDALYVRDITSPDMADFAAQLSAEQIAKTAAIFSLTGHYDQAAEIVEAFEIRLSTILDVHYLLEMLAREIQRPFGTGLTRSEYLAAFARDDAMFYPRRSWFWKLMKFCRQNKKRLRWRALGH